MEGAGWVEVNLSFGGGAEDAEGAVSLYRWLVAEPELRGQVRVSLGSGQPEPGHMGGGWISSMSWSPTALLWAA
ncbi:hypothetical protein NCG97_18090 [Streptomyces lydicamycinicus]|nr:hypothetical protein [Streptomyces lydicamycinicus]USA05250.1 hypothetical protein NCG97_18090 [Streptomyces lydicamycinicus]